MCCGCCDAGELKVAAALTLPPEGMASRRPGGLKRWSSSYRDVGTCLCNDRISGDIFAVCMNGTCAAGRRVYFIDVSWML
jgi:hypothetical protein